LRYWNNRQDAADVMEAAALLREPERQVELETCDHPCVDCAAEDAEPRCADCASRLVMSEPTDGYYGRHPFSKDEPEPQGIDRPNYPFGGRFIPEEPTDEEVARELEAAAREVWISVPSSYDDHDPAVLRHAAALNALGAILARLEADRGK
jgi:hypothetical protein